MGVFPKFRAEFGGTIFDSGFDKGLAGRVGQEINIFGCVKCVACARQEDELCDRFHGGGEQRQEDPRGGFPGKSRNNIVDTAAFELRVNSITKGSEEVGTRNDVRE